MINGVIVTPLREIAAPGGGVFHAMKSGDPGCSGFGEAYFSTVESGFVKPWKRHERMTLNIVVPVGLIRFVLYDDRHGSVTENLFSEIRLGRPSNYARLTVPPGIWMAFQGISDEISWLLNMADMKHDPEEAKRRQLVEIPYDWSI